MFFLRSPLLKCAARALCALTMVGMVWAQPAAPVVLTAPPIQLALIEGLSGPFANTGEAVFRNLVWAVERVNQRGGVKLGGVQRALVLKRYDSKGQNEEALAAFRSAMDDGASFVLQGNSSATAGVLLDAIQKHNERNPQQRVLFLNYAAVDPALTNERCSYWHFRFDAHADMRMQALMGVLKADRNVRSVYLLGQDYSFGQAVLREARRQLTQVRPDVRIAGEELHPMGRIKDFLPYMNKIMGSGAQAVITGNWGNDLTLLVKAAREVGFEGKFYTFYGNALGAPAAIGEAGVGRVLAVAEWMPNTPGKSQESLYAQFRGRFPKPGEDYMHLRMQWMVEALAQALENAQRTDAGAVARALEGLTLERWGHKAAMRASDHQLQQPLVVAVMERQGTAGVTYDVEGSGWGFRTVQTFTSAQIEQTTSCQMNRPPH